eukprot:jgi/Tetstr1/449835/TSEL_036898.t1
MTGAVGRRREAHAALLERIASFGTSGYGCHHGAMRLLVVCAVRQTGFLSRMMPPSELGPFSEAVDAAKLVREYGPALSPLYEAAVRAEVSYVATSALPSARETRRVLYKTVRPLTTLPQEDVRRARAAYGHAYEIFEYGLRPGSTKGALNADNNCSGPVALHPALPFSVDTWDAGPSGARPAFLSHAHKDHTAGLAAWAAAGGRPSRRIFATEDTLALLALRGEGVRARPGVEVVPVVQGEAMFVAQEGFPAFQVTPLDANHGVRGSVMFLFQGAFGTVLHTGDCRLTPSVVSSVQAAMPPDTPLDLVYLDCTFASYRKEFPSVRDALRHAEEAAMRHSLASRVYIGCDGLGCESLLEQLATRLGQRVYMPPPGCGIAFHGKDIEAQRLA